MNRVFSWTLILLAISGLIYMLADTLAPFLAAFIFAYLLRPLIETFSSKFKLPRSLSTFTAYGLFLSGFIAIIVILIPLIYKQFAIFIRKIPEYKVNFDVLVLSWSEKLHDIDPNFAEKVKSAGQSFIGNIFSTASSLANYVWDYTMATLNFFALVALVPVILYYFLRDWPKMVKSIESLLPRRGKSKIREIFHDINELLSAYIRGQLNICMMLSFYYSIVLTLVGLDLAILLGIMSGFFILIPFIGPAISFSIVLATSYFAFGATSKFAYVAILFIVGATIEGYILTPKIIGDRIGLHPVWIIFAVIAAGSVFGMIGIFFAIPIAGIVKVCLSYLIEYYKSSDIYRY